ncbi:MAG: hypothetical protein KJ607_10520 [Bacteroidetes bacterium]|nr:hypothetical protein [Bacteroidota bacterium]
MLLGAMHCFGQFGEPVPVVNNARGACSVFSSDLYGDGDMDLLLASYNDDKIAWYENTDGNGNRQ